MLPQIIIASTLGSVFALIGGAAILWRPELTKRFSLFLVAFAAGGLIGATFLELLPEALAEGGDPTVIGAFVIAGILLIFLFEKVFSWYHHHEHHEHVAGEQYAVSASVILGDTLHNFIDGIVIALSFSVDPALGISTTLAVFFHEIPQEIGDFAILLHLGYERSRIVFYNLLSALATLVGALLGYFLTDAIGRYVPMLIAFAAGSFIYIAVSDLLPELKHKSRMGDLGHILAIAMGVIVIWAVGVFVHE